MDNTQHRWVTTTANNAHFAVPFLIGAGAGAFGAVLFGAVDAGGVPLTVYLGLAAALIGILSAWTLAFWSDRIKRRRKAHVVRLQMEALLRPLEALRQLMASPAFDDLTRSKGQANPWTFMGLLTLIREAAEAVPGFDDMIDTGEDYALISAAAASFHFCRRRFAAPTPADDVDQKSREKFLWHQLMVPETLPAMDKAIRDLRAAENNLRGW